MIEQDDMMKVADVIILFFLIIPLGLMNVWVWGSVLCRWRQRRLRRGTEIS